MAVEIRVQPKMIRLLQATILVDEVQHRLPAGDELQSKLKRVWAPLQEVIRGVEGGE